MTGRTADASAMHGWRRSRERERGKESGGWERHSGVIAHATEQNSSDREGGYWRWG